MNKIYFILCYLLLCNFSVAQITVLKNNGGPFVIKYGIGKPIVINSGSTLTREWIILNDEKSPLQLTNSVGINTSYDGSSQCFSPIGNIQATVPIIAYEIHHVLYDVFGEHIQTLSNVEIADINGQTEIDKSGSWYGTSNQVSVYYLCVSYVSKVRTNEGTIWRFEPELIKKELDKINITYNEGFVPSNEPEKK